MSKKEAKMMASTNRSMKDWVRKVDTPSMSIPENTEHYELDIWSGRMHLMWTRHGDYR